MIRRKLHFDPKKKKERIFDLKLLSKGDPLAMKDAASAISNLCLLHENKGGWSAGNSDQDQGQHSR